jgi:uncharacterized membrane protein
MAHGMIAVPIWGSKWQRAEEPTMNETSQNETSVGMKENVAGGLCYLFGWLSGLVFLLIEQKNSFVRFHAWQSLLTFGALSVIAVFSGWLPLLGSVIVPVISVVVFVLWVVMMVKAFKGERYRLPIVGEIAADWTERNRPPA